MSEIDRVLRSDGVYVANIIDGPAERFLRAEAATIASVFSEVVVTRGPGIVRGANGNSAIVASQAPIDAEALQTRLAADRDQGAAPAEILDQDPDETLGERVGELVYGPELGDYVDGATILTDDFAPVDQLLAAAR